MMQARMSSSDPRLYNPSRDVAHNFQQVMLLVSAQLEDKVWPDLNQLLEREGVSLDDLGQACGAYCNYLVNSKDDHSLEMEEAVKKSGFLDCKPAAQIAVMALIGTCYAGIHHVGIREASIMGDGPLKTVADLLQGSKKFRKMLKPRKFRLKLSTIFRDILCRAQAIFFRKNSIM
jgi:hypothetical protein